ncbi:hypothetical protein G9A89_003922 [Geosiphon pyriformis]|nr:hypothetical protein G9A89_003922 [Geosiphon pyriformis]
MSGPSVKRRSVRVLTTGLVDSGLGHKIKKPPDGFNGMDTDGEASEDEKVPDSKMNTPQAKCFNNGMTIGSSFGSINYDMEKKEEVSLPPYMSFSLDKV